MPTQLPTKTVCLNCDYEVKTENKYCPNCGQENADKRISLYLLLKDAIATAFNFESRVFKTIPYFLFYPGKLTNEFLNGKRVRYMHPFKIYLLSSLLFFFVVIKLFTPAIETAIRSIDKKTEDLNVNLTLDDSTSTNNSKEKGFIEDVSEGYYHGKYLQDSLEQDTISDEMVEKIRIQQKSITDSLSKIIADVSSGKVTNVAVNIDSLEDLVQDSAALAKTIYTFNKKANQKVDGFRRFYRMIQDRNMTPEAFLDSSDIVMKGNKRDMINLQFAEQLLKIGRNDPAIFLANIINNIGTLMFFTLPLLAFCFMPFYIRRKKYYIDHLIFTLHLQGFTFIILTLAALFFHWNFWIISLLMFLGLVIYVWLAFKNVYKQGFIKTTIKAYIISMLYATILMFMLSINLLYSFFMF
ncbi:DUF3667 domain-containing protein (plasmid) [Bernardetia sp. Wsw4-3y2]|uniref:DUF3667 domain-containing protein n=1 Tax=Bernardetia sp. Wsw4-3y2 TaxID=3127471 RepID=UPI0030D064E2